MKLQENLKAFVDGEVHGTALNSIRDHLKESPEDRKAVEDLQRLSTAIREYVTQPEPVGLASTLAALERAKPKVRTNRLKIQQFAWLGAVAAVVLVVGLFNVVGRNGSDDASASASSSPAAAKSFSATKADTSATPPTAAMKSSLPSNMMGKDTASPPIMSGTTGGTTTGGGATFGAPSAAGEAKAQGDLQGYVAEKTAAQVPTVTPLTGEVSDGRRQTRPRSAPGGILVQKNASLNVKVENVADAQHTVESDVTLMGGFVQQSARNESEGEKGEANLTVRVPVAQFEPLLKRIRKLGDVVSESNTGTDVTADVVDMDSRLKVLRAEEGDYLALLAKARATSAIMALKDKVTEIQQEIAGIEGQRKSTKDVAALSTVNVTLTQKAAVGIPKPEGGDSWANDTWATAVNGLSAAGKVLGQLFIFVLVWSPLWIPTALVGAWLYRRAKW